MIRCLEFFSGLGGLHYALQESGEHYEMIGAFDNNPVANKVYTHNFGFCPASNNLEHIPTIVFEKYKADCWLLSPPCQPYTRGGKLLDDQDARAAGLLHLIDVLGEMEQPPRWIFLENVLNFEKSRSRDRLVTVLAQRGYQVEEYLISPNDYWVAIPNDRLRYYLAASKVQDGPLPIKDDHVIRSLSDVLGPAPNEKLFPIRDFLRLDKDDLSFMVPEKYILDYKNYRHDIANPNQTRSTTFTKAYGSNYIIGTGSFLQTEHLDLEFEPDDQATLLTLGLRFFTPTEIALLHGLPVANDPITLESLKFKFSFPEGTTRAQQYRLLGNSLNIRVVSHILRHLLSKKGGKN